ncbi:MAG: hypothetical protein AAF436_13830 [Myxococcota bacterium]
MRVNARWTPSVLLLWLVAAGIATFVVCSGSVQPDPPVRPAERPVPGDTEVEFDIETSP